MQNKTVSTLGCSFLGQLLRQTKPSSNHSSNLQGNEIVLQNERGISRQKLINFCIGYSYEGCADFFESLAFTDHLRDCLAVSTVSGLGAGF